MRKVLGLDIGITSIGWALIAEDEIPEIIGMGSRIIPLSSDDENEFTRGNAISKNQKRTEKRSIRRNNFRYKLRRKYLIDELTKLGMMPDEALFKLPGLQLYELRAKGVKEKLSLKEIGRILYHLNQKRGYKSSRKEEKKEGQKETEYVQKIAERESQLGDDTIGQYFHKELRDDWNKRENSIGYRIKEQVFTRNTYIHEFDRIWNFQQPYHQSTLTNENKRRIRDEIIYHQRPLKSQKGLVSICEFEGKFYIDKNGKEVFAGPKVAPRSSPLFQVCKIWESINNIQIKKRNPETKKYEIYIPSIEEKQKIFDYLDTSERLSQAELLKLLALQRNEVYTNAMIEKKGMQGNLTKCAMLKILPDEFHHLLDFALNTERYDILADRNTGEMATRKRVKSNIETQPLYQLWHCIYSISDDKELENTLKNKFSLPSSIATELTKIDFTKQSFGNKSVKSMRNILPYLQDGLTYDKACSMAGYNHSDSITKEENLIRKLKDKLKPLSKNSLRQPIVEKILNQVINVVNAIIDTYGKPNEIRVELARELKQSREERNDTYKRINEAERNHERIRKLLEEHPEFKKKKVTRRDIERFKLWEEFDRVSPYEPSKLISLTELFSGRYDIEHIIPRSILFDDSFSNKTICPRQLNSGQLAKNQMTGFDFMKMRSQKELEEYIECVKSNKTISRTKRTKLLMSFTDLTSDFIERQLRETQYISRKSREILTEVCRDVYVTSGKVTSHLRKVWGWEDVLMSLQLPKYKSLGLTEFVTYESNGQIHEKEVIGAWSKRDDHRHHAIDALSIACTKQGFIQRINTLNAEHTRNEMYGEIKDIDFKEKLSLLDKYLISKKPFETAQVQKAAEGILVSFKTGKRVAVTGQRTVKKNGKRIVVQSNIIIPRGALSEESVYGKIKAIEPNVQIKKVFEKSDLIFKPKIKAIVKQRLMECDNDVKKAILSLKKKPIIYKDAELTYATLFKEEYVIKYPVQNITEKDLKSIIDEGVRTIITNRLKENQNNPKLAFKDLHQNPVWLNEEKRIPIKSVRCFTGLSSVEAIYQNEQNEGISFVKPANNHHIAIYTDEHGAKHEHVVTFWHAVERKKLMLPVVIKNPKEIWDVALLNKTNYSEDFLSKLPNDSWVLNTSIQQNEMFVFNMSKDDIEGDLNKNNYKTISDNLYRVQKVSTGDYNFRHHLETKVDNKINGEKDEMVFIKSGRLIRIRSADAFTKYAPNKVMLNNLGRIIKIE